MIAFNTDRLGRDGFKPGTRSVWMRDAGAAGGATALFREALLDDASADVCVIGAGMAGMCCAYALARDGARVIVLESGPIGGGETGRTTAHLSNAVDDRYYRLEAGKGAAAATAQAEAHTAAIDAIERMVDDESIDCGFERLDGFLFLPPGEREEILAMEQGAAHRAGLTGVERLAAAPAIGFGPCLRFPGQAQMHPLKFLEGLARALERKGGRVRTGTHVEHVGPDESAIRVTTSGGPTVRAATAIVATNSPISERFAIHTKQTAMRTYAIAALVPNGAVPKGLYWDTSQEPGSPDAPYHYARLSPGESHPGVGDAHDVLIVGGEDHETGERTDEPARWAALEGWARDRCPMMSEVIARWSGQVFEPLDMLPFIGRSPAGPDGLFVCTGDSGMGLTHAAAASLLLPDLISGRKARWGEAFDPSRKATGAVGPYLAHNASVAAHYADWLGPGSRVESIRPGEGKIVRVGLRLLAVHRDAQGAMHARSARCTHLHGVVRWNKAEQSWDCPCHGSRFDAKGRALDGPAHADLEVAQPPRAEAGRPSAIAP